MIEAQHSCDCDQTGGTAGGCRQCWSHTELRHQFRELERKINTPVMHNFDEGVDVEVLHQKMRWGEDHDANKNAFDWFWLVGYLSQKAATSAVAGDQEKAKRASRTCRKQILRHFCFFYSDTF